MKQIPDSKVVPVRFVEQVTNIGEPDEGMDATGAHPPPAKWRFPGGENGAQNRSQPTCSTKSVPSPSKFVPRSLSVAEMLKLGKAIVQSTSVDIYSFDLEPMLWSRMPLGRGVRKAYKATSNTKGFENSTWVIKKCLPKSVSDIQATRQTVEQHTKKVVQMHYLAGCGFFLANDIIEMCSGMFLFTWISI